MLWHIYVCDIEICQVCILTLTLKISYFKQLFLFLLLWLITLHLGQLEIHIYSFISVTIPFYDPKPGQRDYAKDDYCLFCGTRIKSKISAHYLNAHKEEDRVKDIKFMPLHSKRRSLALHKLQCEGNFAHNTKVIFQL